MLVAGVGTVDGADEVDEDVVVDELVVEPAHADRVTITDRIAIGRWRFIRRPLVQQGRRFEFP